MPLVIRKRRYSRKSTRRTRSKKSTLVKRMPAFHLKRKFQWYVGSWTFATTTTSDFWKYLTLTPNASLSTLPSPGIPGWTNYATLFEQYKINAIKITFRPSYNVVNQQGSASAPPSAVMPYMTTVVDPEANTGPAGTYTSANLVGLQADGRSRTRALVKPVSIYIRNPMIYQDAGGIAGALRKAAPWVNTGYNPEHRGAHAFFHFQGFDTAPASSVDVYYTVYAEFRGMNAA